MKKDTGIAMSIAAMNDRFILELREQSGDLDMEEIPHWDIGNVRGGGFFTPTLTEENKLTLIQNKKIWPRGLNKLSTKTEFLEAVDFSLWMNKDSKEYHAEIMDRSPKEQWEKLIETADKLKETKKQIANLNGGAFNNACMAYQVAYMVSEPDVILRLKKVLGSDINSLLARTWAHLDDLEKILRAGAGRITISKQYKPSVLVNLGLIWSITLKWQSIFGEMPPHSKDGCFYRFLQELGLIINEEFTSHSVEKIVRELKNKHPPTV